VVTAVIVVMRNPVGMVGGALIVWSPHTIGAASDDDAETHGDADRMRSPNRLLGTVLGAVHLVVGVAGFFVPGSTSFFDRHGGLLFGLLRVNPALDVLHVLVGAALLLAALTRLRAAKAVNTIAGLIFFVVGVAGLFIVGNGANVLSLNGDDNVLHFASAAILLAVGLGVDRDVHTPVTG
jgi:hypothetical protein